MPSVIQLSQLSQLSQFTPAPLPNRQMKKILLLLLGFLLVPAAANNRALQEAERSFQEATYDRHASWQELAPIQQKLSAAQQQKLTPSERRSLDLLTVKLLQYQYSLLESPEFQNKHGGLPLLQQAKKVATARLARQPRDVEMLLQLYSTQAALRDNLRPTLQRLLAVAPQLAYPHILLAGLYRKENAYAKAMQAYATAVRLETQTKQSWAWMEIALTLPQDAGCHFQVDLAQLIASLPTSQFDEADASVKKSSAYQQAVRDAEKIKQQFLQAYQFQYCVKNTP